MKKIIVSAILLCFISFSNAQNSLLWKVTGNNLEHASYLYGTIHVICPDDFFLPEQTESILEQCDQLVLEMDISDPAVLQTVQKGMINPQRKNIKSDLTDEDQKLLNDVLTQTLGVGIDQMGIMKPWALSTVLSVKLGLDCDQPSQYEMEFLKLAKEADMQISSLESATEQIAIFENIPYEKQLQLLMEGIKNQEEDKELLLRMVDTYKKQDINALYNFILQEEEMKEFSKFLLDNRNVKWIPILIEAMAEKPSFIAFGAGHMAGDKGVIELLKAEGYTVEPVE